MAPLTTPQLAVSNARRLAQEGVTPSEADRGVEVITEAIKARGPLTRAELRAVLLTAGVPTAGQALVHVLAAAELRRQVVRGPRCGKDHCYVTAAEWLGPRPLPLENSEALARLARRYLAGHGPASAGDLAKWAGIRLSDARTGLEEIRTETVGAPAGLVDLGKRPRAQDVPPPRLLGPFDPLLHGWASIDFILGGHRGIVTSNGLFRPFALVDGRAVATWGLAHGQVTIRKLEAVDTADLEELGADAARVLAYLRLPVTAAAITT